MHVAGVIGMFAYTCAHASGDPARGRPDLVARIASRFGGIHLDGTANLDFDIDEPEALRDFGMRFQLRHRIELDAYGRPRSQWWVSGIQTSLVPAGANCLRWTGLNGRQVLFEREEGARQFVAEGTKEWLIGTDRSSGLCEVRSRSGRRWRYAGGMVTAEEDPEMGRLRFETDGAFIREISRSGPPGGGPLMRGGYDTLGRLTTLTFGRDRTERFVWNDDGELTAWMRADGVRLTFAYSRGIVCGIDRNGRRFKTLRWEENRGWRRSDSRWLAPVHLAADSDYDYGYGISEAGYRITVRKAGVGIGEAIYNPRENLVVQSDERRDSVTWEIDRADGGIRIIEIEGRGGAMDD